MNLKCFMVMAFVLGTVVAVPVPNQQSNHLVQRTLNDASEASQTHRSSHRQPISHLVQRPLNDSSGASKAPPSLRPVAPSSHPSRNQTSQTFRHLTQALSGKKTVPSSHNASKKVEDFAKKLRADMEASERVLNVYIKTIQDRHQTTQSKLNRVKVILKGLRDEIANATNFANQYQSQDNDLTKQDALYKAEYEKSYKMYLEEQANIKFEKEFLEQIIKYIQLRKTQKC